MTEPLAIELFRNFQEGTSIDALQVATGMPTDRIQQRLRVAVRLILRANGVTPDSAMQRWAQHWQKQSSGGWTEPDERRAA